jgi:hypothetical protein
MSADVYTREIRESLRYSATWPPLKEVRLGDVGLLHRHEYTLVTTAEKLGISFETRTSRAQGMFEHLTADRVRIKPHAKAQAPAAIAPAVDVGAAVDVVFATAGAVLFRTSDDCTVTEIEDRVAVGKNVLELRGRGEWEHDWVVVTEVVHADRTTVLIASGDDASATIAAKAKIGVGPAALVDAGAGLEVVDYENVTTRILARTGLTPLFNAFAVRKRPLGKGRFGPLRTTEIEEFGAVDYADYD